MAAKRKASERVQNYPSLFPELDGGTYGGSISTSKNPRRRLNGCQTGCYKGKELTSRERRNRKLWASLYPVSKSD